MDEATQSNEQETLMPLTLGIKRLILVGDPAQLPATVISKVIAHCYFSHSCIISYKRSQKYTRYCESYIPQESA